MTGQNQSPRREQPENESKQAASAAVPTRQSPRQRTPTPFPRSERAVSQADGEA